MKYRIMITLAIIVGVFIFRLSVVKDSVKNFEYVYEQVEVVNHNIYYYNGIDLVSVEVGFDNKVDIEEVFNLLSNKSNSFNNSYDTKIVISTKIINYTTEDNCLTINLTDDFLRYNTNDTLEIYSQLKNSFSNLGYDLLKINIEEELLNKIGSINISNGIILYN